MDFTSSVIVLFSVIIGAASTLIGIKTGFQLIQPNAAPKKNTLQAQLFRAFGKDAKRRPVVQTDEKAFEAEQETG